MSVKFSENETCVCKKTFKQKAQTHKASILLSLVIALLPKCPFCVLGYSTVITMCSGKSLHTFSPSLFNWIPIALALLVVVSIIWNFKGNLSYYALVVATLGTAIIAYTELQIGNETLYYLGVLLLFISVLLNGRFQYILKRLNLKSSSI